MNFPCCRQRRNGSLQCILAFVLIIGLMPMGCDSPTGGGDGDDYEELIQTCDDYIPSGTFQRFRYFVDIVIRTARTGEILTTLKVGGSSPEPCPQVIFGSGSSHGDPVTLFDALDELSVHVENTRRTVTGSVPWGLDFQGDAFWITDTGDRSIKKMDIHGDTLASFAAPGDAPRGVAFDGTDLWVVDSAEAKFFQLTTDGALLNAFDIPGSFNSSYAGICFHDGSLWILEKTDPTGARIIQVSTGGAELSRIDLQPVDIQSPLGLTHDGTRFWLSDDTSNEILKIDDTGAVLTTVELRNNNPLGLAFVNGCIWVADANEATMYQYDVSDGYFQYIQHVDQWAESLAHDGTSLYLVLDRNNGAGDGSQNVYKLDDSGNIQSVFTGPEQGIEDMAVSDPQIWIAPGSAGFGSIYRYDLSGALVDQLDTPVTFTDGLALASVAPEFWILHAIDDLIYRVDTDGEVVDIVDPGLAYISNLAWNGSDLWTASGDTLYKIDPLNRRLFYFEVTGGTDPVGIAYDGTNLWVGCNADLHRVDTDGNVLESITLSNLPDGSAPPAIKAMDFDGSHFWVSDDTNDMLFRLDADGAVVSGFSPADTEDICEHVSGLAFDGASLWVACEDDGILHRFDTNGNSLAGAIAYPDEWPVVKGLAWNGTHLLVMTSRLCKIDTDSGNVIAAIDHVPGSWKTDMAHDGTYVWIAADRIYRYDESKPLPEAIEVPGKNITGLAHDGTDLWIADAIGKTIHTLSESGVELETRDIPGYKWFRGITTGGSCFWITDSVDDRIYMTDMDGNMQRSFDTPGSDPWGLTHDGSHLWSVDADNQTVYRMDENGTILDSFLNPASNPRGMVFASGHIWVADEAGHKLYKIENNGNVVAESLLPTAEPRGLAHDGTHLWIGSDADDRIYRIDTSGNILGVVAVPASDIRGLTFDGHDLWVADDGEHRMIRINPADWVQFP